MNAGYNLTPKVYKHMALDSISLFSLLDRAVCKRQILVFCLLNLSKIKRTLEVHFWSLKFKVGYAKTRRSRCGMTHVG
jgi:hypothetical protein